MSVLKEAAPATIEPGPEPASGIRGRVLRIRVRETGKPETNVKIPLSLARMGAKLGARFAGEELKRKGIDLDEVLADVDNVGQILDVMDDKGHVEIFVE